MSSAWQVPPALRPGDAVRVIAPASPLPSPVRFFAGLAWLRHRYEVRVRSRLLERHGYLAGTDDARLAELQQALDEPGTKAIVLARGGYGITRLLERLDWRQFRRDPKWIVGFSDGTALHVSCASQNVCSLHASNVNGLSALGADDRLAWIAALEGLPRESWGALQLVAGTVPEPTLPRVIEGRLFGGNLSLLQALAAAGRLQPPGDAIWLVEEVGERAYRLDRMAFSMRPWIAQARAVVIGELSECNPLVDACAALRSAWAELGVPVLEAAPFGHGARNAPFVQGGWAQLRMERDASAELRFS